MSDEQIRNYSEFCQKMKEKNRIRAQKKIYFWWIQIHVKTLWEEDGTEKY